ncbi:MAG TPA: aspartate/glutamate racemase family protein [Firmicutes bacterium]|nr:aspartate/glutamate racemase family protein [Candidatus Fermentithermobacillaceae bacterium]
MKTIGIIGGMSWESSLEYYRLLNEGVKARLGGLHSAKLLMDSLDFHPIEVLQHQGDWETLGGILASSAVRLETAGADLILLATNTMHKVAPEIERSVRIPLIHIADAAASAIKALRIEKVGLLGTKFTMEQDFYRERLASHGIETVIPGPDDREIVHHVIYNELCLGKIEDASRNEFLRIIDKLVQAGAGGVVLGCTEIPLLVHQEHVDIPIFDTTKLHVEAALDFALQE